MANLQELDLSYNWGLSGPLPAGLEQSALEELDFFVTQTCAPNAWKEWLATVEFYGPMCEAETTGTIDVAVVYTPTALEAAGGAAGIEAEIDLMIAETNDAYAASGVGLRLALVARSEVPYTETHGDLDIDRLADPSDGHLDEIHALRDGAGADLVHLIVGETDDSFYNVCGIAELPGAFGITLRDCGGITFAHELGHNMGLHHDRFQVELREGSVSSHPAYGYANQPGVCRRCAAVRSLGHDHVLSGTLPSGRRHLLETASFLESPPAPRRRPVGHPFRHRVGAHRGLRRGDRPRSHGARGGGLEGPPHRRRQSAADGGGQAAGPEAGVGGQRAGRGRPRRRSSTPTATG